MTLAELGLFESLSAHNTVHSHWNGGARDAAATAEVYLCSVNGLAETGELINIDGMGNRVASTLYGHKKVYFVVGRNKLAPTYDEALWRARNVAAPKNALRFNVTVQNALSLYNACPGGYWNNFAGNYGSYPVTRKFTVGMNVTF